MAEARGGVESRISSFPRSAANFTKEEIKLARFRNRGFQRRGFRKSFGFKRPSRGSRTTRAVIKI